MSGIWVVCNQGIDVFEEHGVQWGFFPGVCCVGHAGAKTIMIRKLAKPKKDGSEWKLFIDGELAPKLLQHHRTLEDARRVGAELASHPIGLRRLLGRLRESKKHIDVLPIPIFAESGASGSLAGK